MERVDYRPAMYALIEAGCLTFGDFRLRSGIRSAFYIDMGKLISALDQKDVVVDTCCQIISRLPRRPDLLADVPTRITPIVSSIVDRLRIPQVTPKVERKNHGSGVRIVGIYRPGQRATLVDDLITSGGSLNDAAVVLREGGLIVDDAVVMVDRRSKSAVAASDPGLEIHAVIKMLELAEMCRADGKISNEQYQITLDELAA